MIATLGLIFLCLIGAALFAGSETGVYSLGALRLRHRRSLGIVRAERLGRLMEHPETLLITFLVGNNLVVDLASVQTTILFQNWYSPTAAELAATLVLTPAVLILGEMAPKDILRQRADDFVYGLSGFISAMRWLLHPVVWPLRQLSRALVRWLNLADTSSEALFTVRRLEFYLERGQQQGVLSDTQDELARNVLKLRQARLRDVMIPLAKLRMLDTTAGRAEIEGMFRAHRHGRLPVFRRRRHDIVGVVRVLDVILSPEGKDFEAKDLMRPIPALSLDTSIDEAVQILRRSGQLMASVYRTPGKALGIVTLKDLVEQIVGELKSW